MTHLGPYELDKVHLGDCIELMKELPDKCVDLVLTDPPYGIGYKYNSYDDTVDNLKQLICGFIPEARRVAHRVAVFTGVQNVFKYPQSDWILSCSWNTTATFGMFGYNQWQPVIVYGKDVSGFGSVNGQLKSDSMSLSGGASIGFLSNYPKGEHPCPKPEIIIKKLIGRLSNSGEVILDPFSGFGTTGAVAIKNGRLFLGFEIDSKYCDLANKRIEAAKAQGVLKL